MVHPIAEANKSSPFRTLTPEQFYPPSLRHPHIRPLHKPLRSETLHAVMDPLPPATISSVICVGHGYSDESSWFVQLTSVHLANDGFAVCAIDHQGHDFSDGLPLHIPDINPVVDDCISFFNKFRDQHALSHPSFLYSKPLGGAIALLIMLRRGAAGKPYDGLVLNGAMCGIIEKVQTSVAAEALFVSLCNYASVKICTN